MSARKGMTWKQDLEVDDKGRLYWNGREVQTKQRVTLEPIVQGAAVVAALSTLTIAVVEVLRFAAAG